MKNMINGTCVGLAFLCTGLGAVGIVLPFLPTTPFFLVAAALFAKGSKRFHRWFTGTALYRRHLEPFVESKTMTMKKKLSVLAMVTALLTAGFIMSPIWHARVVIVAVALAHYYAFFFRIKTEPGTARSEAACGVIPPDERETPQREGSRYSGVTGTAENDRAPADTGHARIREAAGSAGCAADETAASQGAAEFPACGEGRMPQGSAGRHRERRAEKGEENVS